MFLSRDRLCVLLAVLMVALAPGSLKAQRNYSDCPREARKRYDAGVRLQEQGRLREAQRLFESAIRLGMAEFPRVHLHLAACDAGLKRYQQAIARYTRFLEEFGPDRACRFCLRLACTGRAEAYQATRQYRRALADLNQALLLHKVELDTRAEVKGADSARALLAAAQVYRARSRLLALLARGEDSRRDRRKADQLTGQAQRVARKPREDQPRQAIGHIRLHNDWTRPVTVVVDGIGHVLNVGEKCMLARRPGAFTFEVAGHQRRVTRWLFAADLYQIRVGPQRR